MLTLRTFKPFRGTMAASSFALKADALLAMSGLPYEREYSMPQKQPMGKLPVLLDGEKVIPDSALIQRHLETAHGIDFDGTLTEHDKAQATALRRLVEDHLYFLGGHYRWTQHPDIIKDEFFAEAPALIRGSHFPQGRQATGGQPTRPGHHTPRRCPVAHFRAGRRGRDCRDPRRHTIPVRR